MINSRLAVSGSGNQPVVFIVMADPDPNEIRAVFHG
jgi:hypothetical protein